MNPGGIRADLPGAPKADNAVTYGDVLAVQPFGNTVVVMDLTGARIRALLEQQFTGANAGANTRLLQVSAGFSSAYGSTAADGNRVDPASLRLNGPPLDPAAAYRVATTSFLSTGGDNFTVFTGGTNVVRLPNLVDVDAVSDEVQGRVTRLKWGSGVRGPTLSPFSPQPP